MKRIMLLCVIIFIIGIGCGTVSQSPDERVSPRKQKPDTYEVFVPSETDESKMCRVECERVLVMKKQTEEMEYRANAARQGRHHSGLTAMSQVNSHTHQSEYEKCVQGCGGTFETRERKR
jgi:hypothetical protein